MRDETEKRGRGRPRGPHQKRNLSLYVTEQCVGVLEAWKDDLAKREPPIDQSISGITEWMIHYVDRCAAQGPEDKEAILSGMILGTEEDPLNPPWMLEA